MRILFLFLCLFTLSGLSAQKIPKKYLNKPSIRLDENLKEIDRATFHQKFKTRLVKQSIHDQDSLVIFKLDFREYFGAIPTNVKSQLNKLFFKRFGADSTKIWVLHYLEALPNVSEMYPKSGIVFLDSLGNDVGGVKKEVINLGYNTSYDLNYSRSPSITDVNLRHKHVMSYLDFKKIVPRERKKYDKRSEVEFLHFYGINMGYPQEDLEADKWYKDHNLMLRNVFGDPFDMYGTLIVYPDGKYYASRKIRSFKDEKHLLKEKWYLRYQKKWRLKYEAYRKIKPE